jgi:hypothetical protein
LQQQQQPFVSVLGKPDKPLATTAAMHSQQRGQWLLSPDVDPGADRSEVGIYQIRDGKTRGRKPFTPTRPDGARFSERTATGLAG